MSDPFVPPTDPDIPTPKREDLLPHVHGSVRDLLAANKLDGAQAANEWAGARRIWDERHKEAAIKWREQTRTLGGANDMWFGHFYISHLDFAKRQRIREGDFTPQEIEMLAKGDDPWGDRNPLPAGLEPPATLPPYREWVRKVIEQFSPVAERVRQAAVDAAKRDHSPTPEERERTRKGLEALHSLLPPPPEKPKQLGQLLAEMEQKNQRTEPSDSIPGQPDSTEYDRRMAGMGRDRDLFGEAVRSAREHRNLRKREELLEREERLQKRREEEQPKPKPFSVLRASLWPGVDETHARRMQAAFENKVEPPVENMPTFAPIGGTFSEPSISAKLWKLTESNFFWGGGVGVALAAYAFEIGGAPRFAVVLLVIAWLVFTISIFRHGFFERSSKTARFIYQSVISLVIAVMLIITWVLLHPITVQPQVATPNAATPAPSTTPLQVISSPSQTPKISASPTASPSLATVSQTPPSLLPSDTKIALLQCNVTENDKEKGYQILREAVCVAKHQQTGQEFIGTIGEEGVASINVPYGFYIVTIKAKGYITRVEAIRIQQDYGNTVSVVLSKEP